MGSSGSSSGGDSVQTIRYAPYIESKHSSFLATVAANREQLVGSSGEALTYDQWMTVNHPEDPKYTYIPDVDPAWERPSP